MPAVVVDQRQLPQLDQAVVAAAAVPAAVVTLHGREYRVRAIPVVVVVDQVMVKQLVTVDPALLFYVIATPKQLR
jgi:hypothetical protein